MRINLKKYCLLWCDVAWLKYRRRFLGVYFFYLKYISQTRGFYETSGDVHTNT
jgi:hypothetical protein